MCTALLEPTPETGIQCDPQPRLLTRAEYYKMGDLGFFDGQRVELIGGEIVVLSPQKSRHYKVTDRSRQLLQGAYGKRFWIRMQGPITIDEFSEPEPEVSVVEGHPEDFEDHPTSALLALEVSETTLAFDRAKKASLFASANIPHYWIVNLVHEQLEVFCDPVPDKSKAFGFAYAKSRILRLKDIVSLPGLAKKKISVARFFRS
jgi:Uma2 family endonuclease